MLRLFFRTPRLYLIYIRVSSPWCVGGGSADEQQSPVGQRDIAPVRSQSSVFGAVAVHDDHSAGSQGVLGEPRSYQCTRRARLDGPTLDVSVRLFDIDVDP